MMVRAVLSLSTAAIVGHQPIMSEERTRREVIAGTCTSAGPKTNKAGVPLKLQAALDQLSEQPSTPSPELEAYLERTEGWMDRLGTQRSEDLTFGVAP